MMTEHQPPKHARNVTWMVSGQDFQSHAFYELGPVFSEALCTHSVPSGRLVTPRSEPRCITCLLVHGGDLADEHGDPGGFARG